MMCRPVNTRFPLEACEARYALRHTDDLAAWGVRASKTWKPSPEGSVREKVKRSFISEGIIIWETGLGLMNECISLQFFVFFICLR